MSPEELIQAHGVEVVTAALRPLLTDERIARIEAVLDNRLASVTVALENLHDPHNGAAAIRSVEAFGLTSLHAIETVEPFQYTAGITIGAEKWIEVARHPSLEAGVAVLRERGFRLYATVPGAAADIESIDVSGPFAVLFGNEHEGLTDAAVAACDAAVAIPMFGFTQSFNLSVSVALTVQRLAARRRAILCRSGDLEEGERALLRARWYAHSVRAAHQIVRRYLSAPSPSDPDRV